MESVLSKRFIDALDKRQRRDAVTNVEVNSDRELEAKFSECLNKGHFVLKHSSERNQSYGHVCKTCKKYFHRHLCIGGRGSSIGVT